MPITFRCPCGERLESADEDAGQNVRCPTCDAVLTAPAAGPTLATRPSSAGRRDDVPVVRSARGRDDGEDEDRPSRRRRYDEDDRASRHRREEPQSFEGRVFNGSVAGGLGAMVLGLLLFFVPLIFGWIFPYSLILFVIGLVGFIRGLVNRK